MKNQSLFLLLYATRFTAVVASHADILLARHALLPNERLLKRAAINVDQSQHTSKAGKRSLCPLGKTRARWFKSNHYLLRIFQRVSVHRRKKRWMF